jgi:hypothetical protein
LLFDTDIVPNPDFPDLRLFYNPNTADGVSSDEIPPEDWPEDLTEATWQGPRTPPGPLATEDLDDEEPDQGPPWLVFLGPPRSATSTYAIVARPRTI